LYQSSLALLGYQTKTNSYKLPLLTSIHIVWEYCKYYNSFYDEHINSAQKKGKIEKTTKEREKK